MPRAKRKALVEQIEDLRGSRVLCYVTGDRAPALAQIGDDAIRPMYERLREIGQANKLDFFLYSRGGAVDVPWRIVTALRTAAQDWSVLIPFRANSAATLLALGADEIVMGRFGVDPAAAVAVSDKYSEDAVIAIVETKAGAHEFTGQVEISARRCSSAIAPASAASHPAAGSSGCPAGASGTGAAGGYRGRFQER